MAATVTATGVTGPGQALTAGVFPNISLVEFDCVANILTLTDVSASKVTKIAITAATTITATKSGSTYTFTIS